MACDRSGFSSGGRASNAFAATKFRTSASLASWNCCRSDGVKCFSCTSTARRLRAPTKKVSKSETAFSRPRCDSGKGTSMVTAACCCSQKSEPSVFSGSGSSKKFHQAVCCVSVTCAVADPLERDDFDGVGWMLVVDCLGVGGLLVLCLRGPGSTIIGSWAASQSSCSGTSMETSSYSLPPSSWVILGKVHGASGSPSPKCSSNSSRFDAGLNCSTQHLMTRRPLTHQTALPFRRAPLGSRFDSVAKMWAGPKNFPFLLAGSPLICFLQ